MAMTTHLESQASSTAFIVCYSPTMITTNGVWQGDNPLDYALPLFILQAILIVVVSRCLAFLMKPFRQPRFIAEVLAGIILGPTVLGRIKNFMDVLYPTRSVAVIETMANLGVVYFIFLVGIQVDLEVVKRTGRRAWAISGMALVIPLAAMLLCYLPFMNFVNKRYDNMNAAAGFVIFVGVSVASTAFSVLGRILAELKLLTADIGRIAMSSAIISDSIAWVLLILSIAVSNNNDNIGGSIGVIASGVVFVLVIFYAVRPAVQWVVRRTPEGEAVDDFFLVIIMMSVMVWGLLADALGIHAIFGAFIFGVSIPTGPLGATLIEKLEDFVSGFMLPLFFAINGLKCETAALKHPEVIWFLILAVVVSAAAKVGCTLLVSMYYGMPMRDGLSLGILMNTKGLVEMIILHIGIDKKVLDVETFSLLMLLSLAMSALVTPLATMVYKPARHFVSYKRRTVQRSKPETELRMLACVHTTRNVPTIINLLEISHPTKRSPIFIYSIHLVELTGRESAMLIVHDTNNRLGKGGHSNLNKVQAQSEQMIKAFEGYEQSAGGVSVQPLTVVSAYSSMHEDVCNLAEDKRVALIILPFHKQQTVDGGMEATNPGVRTVNQNILANAPCSVGILVDRGLGGTSRNPAGVQAAHHIALLFIGGPDDRESLAYAGRMAEHPGISLTVLRFLPSEDDAQTPKEEPAGGGGGKKDMKINVMTEAERDRQMDDECIKDFRLKNVSDESVIYTEKVANNGEETVAAIRSLDTIYDLYIVGRGNGTNSPLTAGLTDWSECPELGAIGDILASSDFAATVSVLVIQQYYGGAPAGEGPGTPDSPGQQAHQYLNKNNVKGRGSGWGP